MKLSFRKKVLYSFLFIILLMTCFLLPLSYFLIDYVQERHLKHMGDDLLTYVQSAKSDEELISAIERGLPLFLFRVSLIDPQRGFLYDSFKGGSKEELDDENRLNRPEIHEALSDQMGFDIRYSLLCKEKTAYLALPFSFNEKTYLLRLAFPYQPLGQLTEDVVMALSLFTLSLLLLLGFISWLIVQWLTRPIKNMTRAISNYEKGGSWSPLNGKERTEEFGQLASSLNSLVRKIDEQMREITEERNEKSDLLETLAEGVIAVDPTLTIIYLNRMAEDFLGIEKEAVLGKSFHLVDRPLVTDLIREAIEKNRVMKLVLSVTVPKKRHLDVIVTPRRSEGAIIVFQDNTTLHRLIDQERDFIANASHELKTPLTIIRGFSETLREHPELSKEVFNGILDKMVANSLRMENLIKNLLTLASIDEGIPLSRLSEASLVEVAEQAKETVELVHSDAKIEIHADSDIVYRCDSHLMLQALINLIDNGIKYSKAPASITVTIEKRENEVVISVKDRGVGIAPENIDRVFDRFWSVDKAISRSMGGSGLGLSIVKGIVDRHGGKIEVASEVGFGSIFMMRFPM